MVCTDCNSKLDAYLDGELRPQETQALTEHLRGCPTCAADLLQKVQMKRAVQAAGRRYAPRTEFREQVRASIAVRQRLVGRRVWATAAALVLVVLGSFLAYQRQERLARQQILSELADLHVATLASSNPVDVVSSDKHTVKPWFQGKIPFTFNLPELENPEFVLIGGRVVYLGQSPGAQLIYQKRKHLISVFIFQKRAAGRPGFSGTTNREPGAFTTESWQDGNLVYVLIGDAGPEDIHRLGELLNNSGQK